jgi:hypothetical protein
MVKLIILSLICKQGKQQYKQILQQKLMVVLLGVRMQLLCELLRVVGQNDQMAEQIQQQQRTI